MPDERLQLAHRALAVGEHLEHADAGRMGQRLEQLGLHLRQRDGSGRLRALGSAWVLTLLFDHLRVLSVPFRGPALDT